MSSWEELHSLPCSSAWDGSCEKLSLTALSPKPQTLEPPLTEAAYRPVSRWKDLLGSPGPTPWNAPETADRAQGCMLFCSLGLPSSQ